MKISPRNFVLAPVAYVVLGVLAYLTLIGVDWEIRKLLGRQFNAAEYSFPALQQGLLTLTAFVYGVSRIVRFHPRQRDYGLWLKGTPWTYRQSLPLGPLLLSWQDLTVLLPLFLLSRFHLRMQGELPLIAFLLGYDLAATIAIMLTKPNAALPLLVAGLPVGLLMTGHTWWMLGVFGGIYVIAALGLQATLYYFPWRLGEARFQPEDAGWPFARIGPGEFRVRMPKLMGVLISLLLSWWVFCIVSRMDIPPRTEPFDAINMSFLFFGGFIMLVRLVIYSGSHQAPLSVFGRLATGRLILPAHDVVYIAPLTIMAASFSVGLFFHLGLDPAPAIALAMFLTLLPAFTFGPSLYHWHLIGMNRIMPLPKYQGNEKREMAASSNTTSIVYDALTNSRAG